tara:strand:- start:1897 stop:2763 length:867 start_codon:yes stop_codon:yes gene_type:complete
MKKLKKYLLLIIAVGFYFASCDVIEEPFIVAQEEVSDSCEAFIFSPVENYTKKVFLEDYTGHTCGNCPRAAEKAAELQNTFGDQLVVVAVHSGFFSNTSTYPTDFTTESGDAWDELFGNSNAGNPNGMIDRLGFPSSNILQYSQWEEKITTQIQIEPLVGLQIKSSYNNTLNLICIDVESKILGAIPSDLNLTVVLIESGIISKQTDYSTASGYVEDYEQNHVLRIGLTNPWGESLGQNSYSENELFTHRYSIEKQDDWEASNMSVVAFISNPETYEVLQAEEIHLIE